MSDAVEFLCTGELAEHWPDHLHGANGTGECLNETEPCGYCGETMVRVRPAKASTSIRIGASEAIHFGVTAGQVAGDGGFGDHLTAVKSQPIRG